MRRTATHVSRKTSASTLLKQLGKDSPLHLENHHADGLRRASTGGTGKMINDAAAVDAFQVRNATLLPHAQTHHGVNVGTICIIAPACCSWGRTMRHGETVAQQGSGSACVRSRKPRWGRNRRWNREPRGGSSGGSGSRACQMRVSGSKQIACGRSG